jgi:hypothetical protein
VKVSYVEGVASHDDPESCGVVREDGVEALTGEGAGWVLSREIDTLLRKQQALRGADVLGIDGRQHRVHRSRKVCSDLARSQNCSTKTLDHRSAFVNSTTVVGNSTSVLEKKVRVRSCLSVLFFVHAAIGCVEHLVECVAILPFSGADTQAD